MLMSDARPSARHRQALSSLLSLSLSALSSVSKQGNACLGRGRSGVLRYVASKADPPLGHASELPVDFAPTRRSIANFAAHASALPEGKRK